MQNKVMVLIIEDEKNICDFIATTLKAQGYKRASLSVQKANYAVRMYKKFGFAIVDENEEEYIMVCELQGGAKI